MKILVTGANGFIGRNLIAELKNRGYKDVYSCGRETKPEELDAFCSKCEFVFHLAGINRPQIMDEFMEGNFGFTAFLLERLKKYGNSAPITITSSIQAELDNPYGISKMAAEKALREYSKKHNVPVYIYRLQNVFGKWSRPNYNSVVATFCYNISRDMGITITNREAPLRLVYIDDVIEELVGLIAHPQKHGGEFFQVEPSYLTTVGWVADKLYEFKHNRETLCLPDMNNELERKLYSTYLSFLPKEKFVYPLTMHIDERGSFTEFIRTEDRGQVSINVSKVGITKGNHWHHSKNEKFLVVKGKALIQLRRIDEEDVIEYHVSGECLEVVDIPTGYTHNIINEGEEELVTVMWANEVYDRQHPDTYYLEV